jgi:hypothetical protein
MKDAVCQGGLDFHSLSSSCVQYMLDSDVGTVDRVDVMYFVTSRI